MYNHTIVTTKIHSIRKGFRGSNGITVLTSAGVIGSYYGTTERVLEYWKNSVKAGKEVSIPVGINKKGEMFLMGSNKAHAAVTKQTA